MARMQTPLRVLHVHNSADLYGASRSLLRLLKTIDRARFTPVVVLPEDGPLKNLLEAEKIKVLVHPRLSVITRTVFKSWRLVPFALNFPFSVLWLRQLIRREQIALVHTNTGVILSPALASKLAGVPHVWHFRDWFQEFGWVWPLYARYAVSCSKKIVCVSNAVAGQFTRRDNVVVIHNGFSLDEFQVAKADLRREFRARFNLGDDFVVGCVGRIKLVRKGQEVLVRAAALLKQRGRKLKVLIVGTPFTGNESHLEQLQNLALELGVSGDVVFIGELADTRIAYAAMDTLTLTSAQPEPFGGVVMEAMCMGLPVVATNIGGSLDQVVEGETGFLVPPADAAALAVAIEKLMLDAALRDKMGAAAIERIRKNFSLAEMAAKLEQLFDEAVS